MQNGGREPGCSPLPLEAVLLRRPSRGAEALEVKPLGQKEAILELLRYPRVIGWLDSDVFRGSFARTAELAERAPVSTATVPWRPPLPAELVSRLLAAIGLEPQVPQVAGG